MRASLPSSAWMHSTPSTTSQQATRTAALSRSPAQLPVKVADAAPATIADRVSLSSLFAFSSKARGAAIQHADHDMSMGTPQQTWRGASAPLFLCPYTHASPPEKRHQTSQS